MGKKSKEIETSKVILNIASLVGLEPWHVLPVYTASKHAVVGFTRAMSVIYAKRFFLNIFSSNSSV